MKIKFSIIIVIFMSFVMISAYCYDEIRNEDGDIKSIIITKEDITGANPTHAPVEFDKKDLHAIEVMEKRHFSKTYPEFSDYERLKNLEYELFGRIWQFSDKNERIQKLKLASSNRMIIGTALPPSISSKRNAKRMRNDELQLRDKDDVGLIDGFLRLLAPEAYQKYRQYSDNMFNSYEY